MTNHDREERERKATPIIDGDARPDIDLDPDTGKRPKDDAHSKPKEKKFESERHGDVNSLEDYKDAKKD